MVAVAVNHAAKLADVIAVDAEQAVFLDDQNAERVTGGEYFRGHRIVAGAVGVDTVFLQFLEAIDIKSIGYSGSNTGMVLVHVDSLEFD